MLFSEFHLQVQNFLVRGTASNLNTVTGEHRKVCPCMPAKLLALACAKHSKARLGDTIAGRNHIYWRTCLTLLMRGLCCTGRVMNFEVFAHVFSCSRPNVQTLLRDFA